MDGVKVYSTLAEIPPDLWSALHLLFIHLFSKNLSRTYYVPAFYIQEMMRRKKKKKKRKRNASTQEELNRCLQKDGIHIDYDFVGRKQD